MKLHFLIPPILALSLSFFDPCVSSITFVRKGPPQPKPGEMIYEVVTATPRLEDKPRIITSIGTFTSSENATVKVDFSGFIEKASVNEGDQVAAGDTLCLFKGDDLKAETEKKRNELREVQADLAHAKKMLELQTAAANKPAGDVNSAPVFADEEAREKEKPVFDKFAANPLPGKPAEMEDWPSKIEGVQARIDSLTKEMELLELKVLKLNVTAPIAGFIKKKSVTDGTFVEAGASLFDLVTNNPITLNFDVPAEISSYIDKQVKLQASPASAPEIISDGEITYISPSLDPQKHTLEIRARFANDKALIKEGQQGRVIVTTRKNDKLLIIPKDAIIHEGDQNFIFVVTGPQVHKTPVTIGDSIGDKEVAVEANLRVDDLLVVSGQTNLKDLSFVKVVREIPPSPSLINGKEPSSSPPSSETVSKSSST